jgi:hypothetical protein
MTDKALEIRNCCCKIIQPWTPEEIGDAWGLTGEAIRCSEEKAFRKLQKKIRINRKGPPLSKSTNPTSNLLEKIVKGGFQKVAI